MKIIINHSYVYLGGAEKILRSLVDYLVHKGYEVTIMASPKSRAEFKMAFDPKVRCIRSSLPQKDFGHNYYLKLVYFIVRKFYRLYPLVYIKLHRFDVAIAFIEGSITKESTLIRSAKKFAWVHCDWRYYYHNEPFYQRIYSGISEERQVMKKYNKIVCVSESAKKGVIATIGDTGNLCVMYNPINWREIRAKAKEKCPINRDRSKPLIVTIGTLGRVKNYSILLEACRSLKGVVDFELWMIGRGGSEEQNLRHFAEENKLDNVHFLGFQQNPYTYLAQADLFVSTSVSESYGLAVQEAFILGVPVVAVKCSGIEESFDLRFGKLIENSIEELTDALKEIFENNVLQAYRQSLENEFSVNELYEGRMEKICNMLEGKF